MTGHDFETLVCGMLTLVILSWAAFAAGAAVTRNPYMGPMRLIFIFIVQVVPMVMVIHRVWNGRLL